MSVWLDAICFNEQGLVPAIAQDKDTGRILMMAWQNREALSLTVTTGQAVYFSRSRGRLWYKGESSGHVQMVHEIRSDCDGDTITLIVSQIGGVACHTGRASCFYQKLDPETGEWVVTDTVLKEPSVIYGAEAVAGEEKITTKIDALTPVDVDASHVLTQLDATLAMRKQANKDSSYVASLYHQGLNKILEKVGEEAVESILAAKELERALKDGTNVSAARGDVVYELADLWFHSMVALQALGLSSAEVMAELARRFGLSGLDEKAARTRG